MRNSFLENKIPSAPLKIVAMENIRELGEKVNQYLVSFRKKTNHSFHSDPAFEGYSMDNFLTHFSLTRYGTGEGKAILVDTVRGSDLFIMADVLNNSLTYPMRGFENHYSPDDHYQDLKRLIAAADGSAHRITIVMPFLYEGRQHKRATRESLDCAQMLDELSNMGVQRLITFDAHDPSVQNAAPIMGFDNFTPFYQFLQTLLANIPDLKIDKEHLLVISPDEGAMSRAVYFASVLGIDTGMFYKRRDYSTVINGKNPIVAHEFLGDNVSDKDVIIVDDMISSGGSMLDTAQKLKDMGANRVLVCCTYGIFTDGLAAFDEAYEAGTITKVITTNLCYRPPELLGKPYYIEADMSKFLATIIDYSNHDASIGQVITPTARIREILTRYNESDETVSEELE